MQCGHGCLPVPSCEACARPSGEPRPLPMWSDSQSNRTWGTSDSLQMHRQERETGKDLLSGSQIKNFLQALKLQSWPLGLMSTWWGELWSVSKASILFLIGMGELLEAAISHVWSQWRTLACVCSDGCAFFQGLNDPLPTGLQSRTIILPL